MAAFLTGTVCRAPTRRGRRLLNSQLLHTSGWGPFSEQRQYIVAYDKAQPAEDVTNQIGTVLKRHNSWLGAYLPDDAVLIVASNAAIKALTTLPGVKWIVSLISMAG